MNVLALNKIKIDEIPLILSTDYIVDFLNNKNEKEIVLNSFKIASFITHHYNAYDYREDACANMEVHDVFKLINVYGYGVCKQFTLFMGYLLDIYNIKNRILYIGKNGKKSIDHFAIEVYYNSSWHFFDPNLNIYFILDNEAVSAEQIKRKEFDSVKGNFSADIWIKFNKNIGSIKEQKIFQEYYLDMFENIEEFTLCDQRYSYKYELMSKKGTIKWYTYNEKLYYFIDNIKVDVETSGKGISNYERILSTDNISFKNIIFSFLDCNTHLISINDFPLLILDCIVYSEKKIINLEVLINGEIYHIEQESGQEIFSNLICETNIFKKPIYSIEIKSNNIIKTYKLVVQSSNLVSKIYNFIKERR